MSTPINPLRNDEVTSSPPPELEPAASPYRRGENPPWSLTDVVLIGALAITAIFIFQMISLAIGAHIHPDRTVLQLAKNPKFLVPPQFAAYLLVFLYMVGLLRSRGLPFWSGIRWHWPSSSWLLFVIAGVALSIAIELISSVLPIPKQLPIEQYFSDTAGTYLLAIFGITMAPLMEELFFRGYMYPALARHIGIGGSVVITSFLFSLIHAPQLASSWGPMLLIFLVGITLTLVRVRTGSVAAGFLIHCGYNFALFSVMFFSTDHFRHLERMR